MKILAKMQCVVRGLASICFLAACTLFSIVQQRPAYSQTPTFRVQSSLVLVDVIGQDPKSGLPVRDLKKQDFRIFDNGREVRAGLAMNGIWHFRWADSIAALVILPLIILEGREAMRGKACGRC